MQLVLMDMVATRTTLVAPVWNRTASRTWRWIGFKVVAFLVMAVVFGAILVVPLIYFLRSVPPHQWSGPDGGSPQQLCPHLRRSLLCLRCHRACDLVDARLCAAVRPL